MPAVGRSRIRCSTWPDQLGEAIALQAEIAQRRMIAWTRTKRPMVLARVCRDRQVIDAGNSAPHEAVGIELPILIAVAAEPIETVVMPLIGKAHRDTVVVK